MTTASAQVLPATDNTGNTPASSNQSIADNRYCSGWLPPTRGSIAVVIAASLLEVEQVRIHEVKVTGIGSGGHSSGWASNGDGGWDGVGWRVRIGVSQSVSQVAAPASQQRVSQPASQ